MVNLLDDKSVCSREWTGNDRVNQNFFGRVRLDESPLHIRLYWKKHDNAPRKLIGAYRLDLDSLLDGGYLREVEGYPGEVLLRFQRANGGDIEIAINNHEPALKIGTF